MPITIVVQNDFKYAVNDWRADIAESFQLVKSLNTRYDSTNGLLDAIRETTTEYADAEALAPVDPLAYPPYLFADGTWRRDPAYTLQMTLLRVVSYQVMGTDSYQVTSTTIRPLTGQDPEVDVQLLSGTPPRVPTVNTPLTSLIRQTVFATLTDECLDEFVESKKALVFKWAETEEEFERQTRRAMQRDSAIVYTIKMAANPGIGIGDTVRVVSPKRSLDTLMIVTGRAVTYELETGASGMLLTLERWVR